MICRICEDEMPASASGLCMYCQQERDWLRKRAQPFKKKPNWTRRIVFALVFLIGGAVVLWMAGAVFTNVVAAIRGMMA